ncbi:MAG: HlyD family efflux transporter periplasmic adaptor subunit [Betaproteobacteria bacterium]|nr:HlyD family efflux transporter periplasmic adaptor subunit [Betaproteobacteria bacterium]
MTRKLFRQEAIDAQREKFLGEATIARPLPLWILTALAAGCAALMIAVAVWGQYTRRERVEGFLQLDAGAARVTFAESGRVAELLVKEGQVVQQGDPMVRLALDKSTAGSASTSAIVTGELSQRKDSLAKEQSQLKELAEQQLQQAKKRVSALESEIKQLDGEARLQQQRVTSAQEQAQRFKQLAAEKFVSDIVARQKADEATDQELKLQALKRQRATLDRELSAAKSDEPSLALKARNEAEKVARQISEVQQNLAQEDARRESVIRAPTTGVVTNIAVAMGQSVASDAPFATILPSGAMLQAEVLVPTRAIGFVTKGKELTLRYDAFPYERFGQYRAVITDVSQTVWAPGEKIGPLVIKEPAYRIVAKLDQQSVRAVDSEVPLRPGMLFNADILLEKRSILEWVFEPVLQLKGRL